MKGRLDLQFGCELGVRMRMVAAKTEVTQEMQVPR
jgi:hypothetical protein